MTNIVTSRVKLSRRAAWNSSIWAAIFGCVAVAAIVGMATIWRSTTASGEFPSFETIRSELAAHSGAWTRTIWRGVQVEQCDLFATSEKDIPAITVMRDDRGRVVECSAVWPEMPNNLDGPEVTEWLRRNPEHEERSRKTQAIMALFWTRYVSSSPFAAPKTSKKLGSVYDVEQRGSVNGFEVYLTSIVDACETKVSRKPTVYVLTVRSAKFAKRTGPH